VRETHDRSITVRETHDRSMTDGGRDP
jgi:hypothetical protein